MATKFTMKPVSGLPARKPRKPSESGPSRIYYPLFEQIIEADGLGFFADADNYLEVAAYGGAGTASATKKAMQTGKVALPAPPEGKRFTVIARRVERTDTETVTAEDGTESEVESEIKSVLLVRIDDDTVKVDDADDAVDGEPELDSDEAWEQGYHDDATDSE